MKVIKETTIAGNIIHRTIKVPSGKHGGKRKARKTYTSEAVKKNNFRLAVWRLWMLLCNNFTQKDAHFTLTHAGKEPSKKEAASSRRKFIGKLRKEFRKNGQELKYIMVTEMENHRIHHHVVINTQDITLIQRIWTSGHVHATPLYEEGDYHDLAEYLVKETEKTFRLEDSQHKHRYTRSRNLIMPVTKREEVGAKALSEEPHAVKGYYIPKERINRFEHPVTGLTHLEYIEVAIKEPKKYKRWPRGKEVIVKEWFKANKNTGIQEEWKND